MNKINCALGISLALASSLALAETEAETLPVMKVEGSILYGSYTTPSIEEAQEKLDRVPGGTSLVPDTIIRDGMTRSLQEALSLVPGVYAKSRFGNDEVRLSIRGSGISQTFNTRGIRLLRDGLPMTEADGNARPQLIEPLNARYIEVYRGANALEYGAAVLGGAINLVSPNARMIDQYPLRLELGSHNYKRFQAANGTVMDNGWDAYGSITGIGQDGFRSNAEQDTSRFYGNTGLRHDSGSETRIHVDVQDNNIELPGSLTKKQVKDDPTQANSGSKRRNSQRDFDLYRLSAQHSMLLDNGGRADFGSSYQYLDMYHPLSFRLLKANQNDVTLSSRVTQPMNWGNRDHELVYGGLAVWGDSDNTQWNYTIPGFGPDSVGNNTSSKQQDSESEAWGLELFVQDTIALNDQTALTLGVQGAYAVREDATDYLTGGLAGTSDNRDETYTGISPRVGLVRIVNEDIQLFGNLSRSFEPPTNSEFAETLSTGDVIIDAQTATTLEIGSRGKVRGLNYEIAAYYAAVSDEIMNQEDPTLPVGSGQSVTFNVDDTIHKGVELGIDGFVTDNLRVALSYTYSDFSFDDDSRYGNNELPGIPKNFGAFEAIYHTDNGFSFGPTVEYSSDWYVDLTNTLEADSYTVWGLKGGYEANKNLIFFVEGVNLSDKKYASNSSVIDDAGGNDAAVFNPGMDRSVYVGFELLI